MRAIVSNQLAVDGDSWAQFFSAYHSGTYANQWMVLALDRFTAGQLPYRGFLTVVEEVPGYMHYEDLTPQLWVSITDWHVTTITTMIVITVVAVCWQSPGYWLSYNNPFFDDIFILSGYLDECVADASMCHSTDPRALIFKQRQRDVVDLASLMALIRYNDFQRDAFSLNDSCNVSRHDDVMLWVIVTCADSNMWQSISCRSDLQPNPLLRYPFGAIDAKVSSVMSVRGASDDYSGPKIFARLGPTTNGQEPFCWSKFDGKRNVRGKRFSHLGQPECFDFEWQVMPPPN
jgi:Phospholipase B